MTKAIEAAAEAFAKESWGAVWWAERSEAERQAETKYKLEKFGPMIRAAISAYLKALAEDEAVVERVARAMLADELNVYDRHEREKAWGHESEIWLSNARAAIAAIEEQKP